jgi:hypothetical protein
VSELKCGGCGQAFDDATDLGDHEYTCEGWGDRKPWDVAYPDCRTIELTGHAPGCAGDHGSRSIRSRTRSRDA